MAENVNNEPTAVFYLARGADEDAQQKFEAFRSSYGRWASGLSHRLEIIYKGFANASQLASARDTFAGISSREHFVPDVGFDLGAYLAAAGRTDCVTACFLNTSSEIAGPHWLAKLFHNLEQPGVGIVGCSGSYEAPRHVGLDNLPYPNPHIRSNAFMLRRERFIALAPFSAMREKNDAHAFEHGIAGMTRRVLADGLKAVVVGKNGRGYEAPWWPRSETFRQGTQRNLLVTDNRSRHYDEAPIALKRALFHMAWGDGTLGQLGRAAADRATAAAS